MVKKILEAGLVCALVLLMAAPVSATDPDMHILGDITVDGQLVGAGFQVKIENIIRDRTFEGETNSQGHYNIYIGTDLQPGDIIEITEIPLDQTTQVYMEAFPISNNEIITGYINNALRFARSLDANGDKKDLGVGYHDDFTWKTDKLNGGGTLDITGTDFDLVLGAQGHITNIQTAGDFDLQQGQSYWAYEKYTIEVWQIKFLNPYGYTERIENFDTCMEHSWNAFGLGSDGHWDPTYTGVVNSMHMTADWWHTGLGYKFQIKVIWHADMGMVVNGQNQPRFKQFDDSNTITLYGT